MKLTDLRKKDLKSLEANALALRTKLAEKKRAMALGELTKHSELGQIKKQLAQTLTLIKEQPSTPKDSPKPKKESK